uniref:hypothetical protein n=1 Tax=Pseudomonas asplenii TaxID=53407 RepID=UPI001E36930B
FVEKYKKQPLFRDVDKFLSDQGFTFHCFTGYGTRSPFGVKVDGSPINGMNQWLWSDAFYFRSFTDLDFWRVGPRLVKLACVFHMVYQSYDFSVCSLRLYDAVNGSNLLSEYVLFLQSIGVDVKLDGVSDQEFERMIEDLNFN